jgi:hypothetical protein
MGFPSLDSVAERVLQRARRQGYVLAREIRQELRDGGLDDSLWEKVVARLGPSLRLSRGRYHYSATVSERERQEQQKQAIEEAVRGLMDRQQASNDQIERREQDRIDFIQPIKIRVGDGREYTVLTRNLSSSGIRLIGSRDLLGQKIEVELPKLEGGLPWRFLVRILWTFVLGDDLFENGGMFLEMID